MSDTPSVATSPFRHLFRAVAARARSAYPRALLLAAATVTGTAAGATLPLPDDTWRLVTLPGDAGGRSVATLFGDELPMSGYTRTWTIFTHDAASGAYAEPAAGDTLATGEAFWIVQRTGRDVTLDVPLERPATNTSAACPSDAGCVELALPARPDETAWSAVGAPDAGRTRIADLRLRTANGACVGGCDLDAAAAAGLTAGSVWARAADTSGYDELGTGDSLAPWRGFWMPLRADAAATLLVPISAAPAPATPDPTPPASADIDARNAALGRGINLGNALEAPTEGAWGLTLEAWHFDAIADAGFDSVRVPIRWSAHASESPPYTIDPTFFERIDWVLEQAARTDLVATINVHHYDALMADPPGHRARLIALWRQIAGRYAGRPDDELYFELLNEPTERFNDDPALWNALAADALDAVRASNPTRPVVIGPVGWNSIDRLDALALPDDPNLIATVHFYSPFSFTHQGAGWVDPVPPVGTEWRPGDTAFGASFRDWSWESTVTENAGVLNIAYDARYAAFSVHRTTPFRPTRFDLETRGRVDAAVICGRGGDFVEVGELVSGGSGWRSHSLDLAACGAGTDDVALQNRLVDAPAFDIRDAALCSAGGCERIVVTTAEAIEARIAVAERWAEANGVPVLVGEFGAYSTADMASRARWTETVQRAALDAGMSSAYWEFASGFGAYDPDVGAWRAPLLDALLD